MEHRLAPDFSLDIPRVMAVELPLKVNNTEKAIDMIGGKDKITKIINANARDTESHQSLELRLRKDRFCHPIQSSITNLERILLKVSVPKRNLPKDYKSLSIQDILKHNEDKGAEYTVLPVGIINQTHSFKSMADFQVSTRNNPTVQKVNENLMEGMSFNRFKEFVENENFNNNQDYKDPNLYLNKDHQLPPPPVLSPIKFPFNYQYEKNSISVTIRDPKSGELKVVSKKPVRKLHTQIVNVNDEKVPEKPSEELVTYLAEIKKNLVPNTYNHELVRCIEWLNEIFEDKPIWLRKHIEAIIPEDLKRSLKQALPYVSYIFKNGPWRFCSVAFGVNPKTDKSTWIYQSEYFRIANPQLKKKLASQGASKEKLKLKTTNKFKVPADLIFQGNKLPSTITFQVGDLMDKDIQPFLDTLEESHLRETLDFQDGWINKQAIETIRQIIRYKLHQLVVDSKIDAEKITKIIDARYDEKPREDANMEESDGDIELGDKDMEAEEDEDEDEEDVQDEEDAMEVDEDFETASEKETEIEVLDRIKAIDSVVANKLKGITDFIRQESLM